MRLVALILLFGCVSQRIPERFDSPIVAYPLNETTLDRDDVRVAFDTLLRKAAYGQLGEERAGFLVFDEGHFRLALWPPTHKFHAEEWQGPIPKGTVAVVHTHPPGQPAPSTHDQIEAQRVGIPILVITPESVVLVNEDGRIQRLKMLHILTIDETALSHPSYSR